MLMTGNPCCSARVVKSAAILLSAGLFILLSSFQIFASWNEISGSKTPAAKGGGRDWTVMVYLDGDNDLEHYALKDIDEMERALPAKGVEVIVLIDRAHGYSNAEGNWTDARIYRIRRDGADGIKSDVLAKPGELNMGDPNVLKKFIAASIKAYPARRYALVMWNHGGGWIAHAVDQMAPGTPREFDKLNLPELREAVDGALKKAGVKKLDLVAFDMCLMAQMETAYELEGLADVMVASEASAPGDGWPYDSVISLFGDPRRSTKETARGIVAAFNDYYQARGNPIATHSAFDLSMVGRLATSLDALLIKLNKTMAASWPSLTRALFFSVSYSDIEDVKKGRRAVLSVDLGDIFKNLAGVAPNLAAAPEYRKFDKALNEFVIESRTSQRYKNSQGVSIYAPFRKDLLNNSYQKTRFAKDTKWLDTLNNLYRVQDRNPSRPRIKKVETISLYRDMKVSEVLQLGQDGFSFVFDGTNILWAKAFIGQRDKAGRRTLIYQKSFLGGKEDIGKIKAKKATREELLKDLTYPDGENEVRFRYDATRNLVTNGEKTFPVTVDVSDIGDLDAHLRVVPALYEHPEIGKMSASIYFNWLSRAAAVVVHVPQKDGTTVPTQIEPAPDADIHLLIQSVPDKGKPEYVISGTLKWKDGLSMTMDLVPEGDCEVMILLESLTGHSAMARHLFRVARRDDGLDAAIRQAPKSDYTPENFIGEWEIIDAEVWFKQKQMVSIGAFKKYEPHPKNPGLLKYSLYKPKGKNILPGLDIVEIIQDKGIPHLRQYVLDGRGAPSEEYGVRLSLPIFDISQGRYLLLSMDLVTGDMGVAVKISGPPPKLATPAAQPPAAAAPPPSGPSGSAASPVIGAWMATGGQAVVFSATEWVYYENGGVLVDQGVYGIQGNILTTRSSRSGQEVPYMFQISGNQLLLQNPAGELYQFYRAR